MHQTLLLTSNDTLTQTVAYKNIKATFTNIANKVYEVVLEISSHKFLIKMHDVMGKIEQFEILAIKGFLELSQKSINTLKQLVEHLYYRID